MLRGRLIERGRPPDASIQHAGERCTISVRTKHNQVDRIEALLYKHLERGVSAMQGLVLSPLACYWTASGPR